MTSASYSFERIAKIVRGKIIKQDTPGIIEDLTVDSRKLIEPAKSLFFAIKGQRRDGHMFLKELYDQGVRHFVISKETDWSSMPEANVILVKDTISALQSVAAHHRKQFQIPVIGITGSNGKTIVKEWLYQLLQNDYVIVRSPKSFNSQIGVPLSVWQINDFNTLAIFEAGISQPDEMQNLQKVIQPTIGVFTNLGNAHDEGFLNKRQKINEKLKLFSHAEIIILCRDYSDVNECLLNIRAQQKKADPDFDGFKTFSWSKIKLDADVHVTNISKNSTHSTIELDHGKEKFSFAIPFIDDASIENAIHCWMVLRYLKINTTAISERLMQLSPVAMRLELKDAVNRCSLINDTYNSDLNSLSIALDFLSSQQQHEKKTVILSDILQSGMPETELYREVSLQIHSKGISRLIGIGPALLRQQQLFSNGKPLDLSFYQTTDQFLQTFRNENFEDETILLKGARIFEFERISKRLEQQAHETILEIDLNALLHNLSVYQSLLQPQTKMMVMVKAFSYGSGSYEIANALQFHRVDYLGVAYADEGIELRKAGITLPVMIMNPDPKGFDQLITYHLEPELYSLRILHQFLQFMGSYREKFPDGYPVHLELETGMNRLGFGENDLPELLQLISESKLVRIQSVFTHLAASEDADLDFYSKMQIDRFQSMSEAMTKKLNYPVIRHVLNSAGILRFPEAHFDMVRLGIGLYGFDATEKIQPQLKQVSTLKTIVSQIKKIKAGETIGYGRMGMAEQPMTIATVGIGYADGLNRSLSRGEGKMLVRGKPASIVGNICMDMTMIDITGIPDAEEGDEVIVFGKELPVQQMAQSARTIPYEIISTISRRVKRIYYQE